MRSPPVQTDGTAPMSSQTYHAIVKGHENRRHRKLLILTEVTTTAGDHTLPSYRQARVSPGSWGHWTTAGDRITFDAEVSASTGQLIRIVRVHDDLGRRLDQDRSE